VHGLIVRSRGWPAATMHVWLVISPLTEYNKPCTPSYLARPNKLAQIILWGAYMSQLWKMTDDFYLQTAIN
jgi:hypothetical protein